MAFCTSPRWLYAIPGEIADAFISLGLGRSVARTLSSLQNVNEATTIELERSTGLRQPEVSIVMRQLKEHDWIKEREEKKPGKGKPFKICLLVLNYHQKLFILTNKSYL